VGKPFERINHFAGLERGSPEWRREHRYSRIKRANERLGRKLSDLRKQLKLARDPNYDAVTRTHVVSKATMGLVRKLASVGVTAGKIAHSMRIELDVFMSHYGEDYEACRLGADVKVLATFHKVATDPNHPGVIAAGRKWLEVNVEGWKEVKRIETQAVGGTAGAPIIDSRKLSPEERSQLRELMLKMTAPDPVGLADDRTVVASQYMAAEREAYVEAGLGGGEIEETEAEEAE
jgi:hypothetical protein